jgi:hypothetical protein
MTLRPSHALIAGEFVPSGEPSRSKAWPDKSNPAVPGLCSCRQAMPDVALFRRVMAETRSLRVWQLLTSKQGLQMATHKGRRGRCTEQSSGVYLLLQSFIQHEYLAGSLLQSRGGLKHPIPQRNMRHHRGLLLTGRPSVLIRESRICKESRAELRASYPAHPHRHSQDVAGSAVLFCGARRRQPAVGNLGEAFRTPICTIDSTPPNELEPRKQARLLGNVCAI